MRKHCATLLSKSMVKLLGVSNGCSRIRSRNVRNAGVGDTQHSNVRLGGRFVLDAAATTMRINITSTANFVKLINVTANHHAILLQCRNCANSGNARHYANDKSCPFYLARNNVEKLRNLTKQYTMTRKQVEEGIALGFDQYRKSLICWIHYHSETNRFG